LDPETAHGLAVRALRWGLAGKSSAPDHANLATRLWGLSFANPLGLAAGFDKDAEVVAPMLRLGFGFVEVGSITPLPQAGNPRPRLFRLEEDRAVINRMGFNSEGLMEARRNVESHAERPPGILGINLGKNKDSKDAAADYRRGVEALGALADYLVVNVSSPNTPGLRALQERAQLEDLLGQVRGQIDRLPQAARPPLVVKIAPDLTEKELEDVAGAALSLNLDGLAVGNTTISRPGSLGSRHREEAGGLSGRPLEALSTRVLARVACLTDGRLPLIGIGGVDSGETAFRKILAGASLVQLYTGLVYEGPPLVGRIKRELSQRLRESGYENVADAVGKYRDALARDE
jgi:dihydroorotate dehydrogenase